MPDRPIGAQLHLLGSELIELYQRRYELLVGQSNDHDFDDVQSEIARVHDLVGEHRAQCLICAKQKSVAAVIEWPHSEVA